MSLPNLAGIIIYTMVIFLCLLASIASRIGGRPARHVGSWLAASAFFGALSGLRLYLVEERTREMLRHVGKGAGEYADRALLQVPLVVLTLGGALLLVLFAIRTLRRTHAEPQERIVLTALFAMGGYVPLYALRTISWHQTDQILYHGVIHLNWLVDVGLALIVTGSAVIYMLAPRANVRPDRARRGRR